MGTITSRDEKKDSSAELLAAAARSSGAAFAKAAEAMKSSGPHAELKGQATVKKTVYTNESIAQFIKEHEATADLQKLYDLLAETRSELDYAKSLLRLCINSAAHAEDFLKGNE